MLRNYLKIAVRNLKRHKVYSIITITGLAIGMACFLLITLFVKWELSYDSFHEKGDRLFRVVVKSERGTFNLGKTTMGVIPPAMATSMKEEFPEVIKTTCVFWARNYVIKHNEQRFRESGLVVDENFLKMFSFPLAQGHAETILREPLTMVLTEEFSKKIFGDENPLYKTLTFPRSGKSLDFTVTGVIKDIPKNTHLQFDFLLSIIRGKMLDGETHYENEWRSFDAFVYVELAENADPLEFGEKLAAHYEKHSGRQTSNSFILQPVESIHLRSDAFIEMSENYKMSNIYMFSCIAFVILFIACINYINLVTAQGTRRSKEIGIRKVVGAQKKQLIRQFLGESIFLSFLSFSAAFLLVIVLFPAFRAFIGRDIEMNLFKDLFFLVETIGLAFLIGIVAGIFPSLFMSSFQPVNALKGKYSSTRKRFNIRNLLVVAQFSISIILIAGTLVIVRQMNFIRTENMGYDREQILVVEVKDVKLRAHFPSIKNRILLNPQVLGATFSNSLPNDIVPMLQANVEEGTFPDSGDRFSFYYNVVDQDFLDVYGITLLYGRNFSEKYAREGEESVIINETAARQLGWKEPLGKTYRDRWFAKNGRVVGVIKDFHFQSLHQTIEPLTLLYDPVRHSYLSLKLNPTNLKSTIASIRNIIESYKPDFPFTYYFLDDSFNNMYREDKKLGTLFGGFSLLAVFISCLGLFGLASFTVENRTKEVGIRKVLGASLPGIFLLLTKEFTKWVALANLIAWPLAYYFMNKWIQKFAYRSDLDVWIFVFSGLIALCIAVLTVSFQSLKAATADPVDSLRYE
jgi:putative ABC transport system permease protein